MVNKRLASSPAPKGALRERARRQQGELQGMPSDRGTLPRGSARSGTAGGGLAGNGFAGGNDQRTGWPEPTAPVGRRLPSAPRERKPALAALAVLLIIGGALGAGFLVIQSGKRVAAVEISQQIGAGQQIPLSAIQQVQITPGSGLAYVPWAEASQVARYFTISTIPAGTLLTRQMVATTGPSVAGRAVLGLALKDGQLPHGLQDGDHIDIYQVSDAQETCPGGSGGTLAADAVVLAIGAPSATSGSTAVADVEVAVNPSDAGPVACNAANGIVGIAVLPDGGRGAAAAAGAGAGSSPGASTAGSGTAGSGTPTPSGPTGPGGTASASAAPGTGSG